MTLKCFGGEWSGKRRTIPPTDFDYKHFKAWLATKPANEVFEYHNNHDCCVAQYLKALPGASKVDVYSFAGYVTIGDTRYEVQLPMDVNLAAMALPRTFGTTLDYLITKGK